MPSEILTTLILTKGEIELLQTSVKGGTIEAMILDEDDEDREMAVSLWNKIFAGGVSASSE